MEKRDGTTVIGSVKAGSEIRRFRDLLIIVHPDDPVKYIDMRDPVPAIRDLPFDTPDYPGFKTTIDS